MPERRFYVYAVTDSDYSQSFTADRIRKRDVDLSGIGAILWDFTVSDRRPG